MPILRYFSIGYCLAIIYIMRSGQTPCSPPPCDVYLPAFSLPPPVLGKHPAVPKPVFRPFFCLFWIWQRKLSSASQESPACPPKPESAPDNWLRQCGGT